MSPKLFRYSWISKKKVRLDVVLAFFIKRFSRLKIEEAKDVSPVPNLYEKDYKDWLKIEGDEKYFARTNFSIFEIFEILVIKKAILKVAQRGGDPRSFDHYIWKL